MYEAVCGKNKTRDLDPLNCQFNPQIFVREKQLNHFGLRDEAD